MNQKISGSCRSYFFNLTLSVTYGDTSPKGRGKIFAVTAWLSLGESWARSGRRGRTN